MNVVDKCVTYCQQGYEKGIDSVAALSSRDLALAVAVGFTGGFFPIPGATTPPCMLLAFLARLPAAGHVVVQIINFSLTLFELLSVPYSACLGKAILEWQFDDQASCRKDIRNIVGAIQDKGLMVVPSYLWSFLQACVAWALFAPVVFVLVYIVSQAITQQVRGAQGLGHSSNRQRKRSDLEGIVVDSSGSPPSSPKQNAHQRRMATPAKPRADTATTQSEQVVFSSPVIDWASKAKKA
eukprot:TRINITY_DN11746_c0_g2_i2.p1 TRINITY_DN11746_c0_g2~~TRINITY_DN11746_c0_g2_i2.p1  ORF type:complete len:239 (+),score=27.75 TRINITY_DN11746_c0_g2_i2:169-885(+)